MNKLLLLIVLILGLSKVQSQVSLDWAADFTVTDLEGNTINLFSILEGGQWVVINFGAYWCGPCAEFASDYGQIYEDFGCNTSDVFFIEMDSSGTNPQCENFINTYGGGYNVPYICNASDVYETYEVPYYPTTIIIDPNGFIRNKDIWPISYNILVDHLEEYGLSLNNCNQNSSINESDINLNGIYIDMFGIQYTIPPKGLSIMNKEKYYRL